jgi:hypothetical protein
VNRQHLPSIFNRFEVTITFQLSVFAKMLILVADGRAKPEMTPPFDGLTSIL